MSGAQEVDQLVSPFEAWWSVRGAALASELGPPVVPFSPLFWGRVPLLESTTEEKGILILASLLEDLIRVVIHFLPFA